MDMPLIANYIEQVVHKVKFIPARLRVQEELCMHFEELIDYYLRKGLSEEEAQLQSIADMGDANELGKEFNKVHHPLIGYGRLLSKHLAAFCIPILLLCAGGIVWSSYEKEIEPEPRSYIIGEIISEQEIKDYITLEDSTYRFSSVVYDSEGNLYLFYHKAGFNVIKNLESQFARCKFYDDAGQCYGDKYAEVDYYDGVAILYNVDVNTKKIKVDYQGYQAKDAVSITLADDFFD